jgi:hypothetical protein
MNHETTFTETRLRQIVHLVPVAACTNGVEESFDSGYSGHNEEGQYH